MATHDYLEDMFVQLENAAAPCVELADSLSRFCEATRDRLRALPSHLEAELRDGEITLEFTRWRDQWDIVVHMPGDDDEYGTLLTQAPLETKIAAAPLLPPLVAKIKQLQEGRRAQLLLCGLKISAFNHPSESEEEAK